MHAPPQTRAPAPKIPPDRVLLAIKLVTEKYPYVPATPPVPRAAKIHRKKPPDLGGDCGTASGRGLLRKGWSLRFGRVDVGEWVIVFTLVLLIFSENFKKFVFVKR